MSEALVHAREAFERRAWGEAFEAFHFADREHPLEPGDLESFATAAHLLGRSTEAAEIRARSYQGFVERGDAERAARCAFWIGFEAITSGEAARGSGWLARARRVLSDGQRDCAEQGLLLLPAALRSAMEGDHAAAYDTFGQAAEIGDRFGEADLVALARQGQGRALIRMGRTSEGVALLDEVMLAVISGEIAPVVAGIVYCSVLSACQEIFDLRRAQEWTDALTRWCESQPDLVPYRGWCLVRRSELLQLHGAWSDALQEAERARVRSTEPPDRPAAASACYQAAELHRLRGDFRRAEAAYRDGSREGRQPEPGLALLRLAQGQTDAALAAIRRALDEAAEPRARSRLLPAFVEIALALHDVSAAREGADELTRLADALGAPVLRATAAYAQGAVLLAEGAARSALSALRGAWSEWQSLEVPYESARTRVLVGLACRALGDDDGAEMELDAARTVFEQLGASPDVVRVRALSHRPRRARRRADALTAREGEVLALVATGRSNREIAAALAISEKTVARHVSNLLGKLGLPSRAAATAYAYQHGLVDGST